MSDPSSLEQTVRTDPTAITDHAETVRQRLASGTTEERLDASRALREAADADPELVAPFSASFVSLLSADHGALRLAGTEGTAAVAAVDPETAAESVPRLLELLATSDAPAIQFAALRALATLGEWSPERVAAADEVVATRLADGTAKIRAAIPVVFGVAVVERPATFPATVRALEAALEDDDRRVQRGAAATLGSVATVDPTPLSSLERVRERVEHLDAVLDRGHVRTADEVREAARTLRSLSESDSESGADPEA